MKEVTEEEFRELRHRYYKIGKGRERILEDFGYSSGGEGWEKEREKEILFEIMQEGMIDELKMAIEDAEKKLEEAEK